MLKLKRLILIIILWVTGFTSAFAQNVPPGSVLVLYNSTDPTNSQTWAGGLYAQMLANLLGHFDLPYVIRPVTNYQAGDLNAARATFYLGTDYNAVLPSAFKTEALTATNPVCWFKYHIWDIGGANFESKFGFRFIRNDSSGFSNIIYKGESFPKNQSDKQLSYLTILNTNLAKVPAVAAMTDANGVILTNIPYVVRASNFWYVADNPLKDIAEEDRYTVFCDLLHDILGSNHPERHRAVIRIEDVSAGVYSAELIHQITDLLSSNAVRFAMATIPVWTDPLGYFSSGTPVTHRLADGANPIAVNFREALRYATTNGGQIIIHGYTHQYNQTNNPDYGVSGGDYEFWRKNNSPAISQPVPEDSVPWVSNRLALAKNEFAQAGLPWVAWETPHYLASPLDYRVMATNFPILMQRGFYFAADYDPATNGTHYLQQFFSYVINQDAYGCKLIPENLGYYNPPSRLPTDMIRVARKNLVVRDGWASAYFHGYLPLTNLQAIVSGIKALGYTYVPLAAANPTVQLAALPGATNRLSFVTEAGFNYVVEYKDKLTDAVWLPLTNALGSGGMMTVDAVVSGTQRYYRLRVE